MTKTHDSVRQDAIARRLRAIRAEIGIKPPAMAKRLGVGRTRYINWETLGPSGNMPAEEAMALLCDQVPGLTMDYIYRGILDAVPHALAIRLTAHEEGLDPDPPEA